jgi:hypothetical protein
MNSVFLCNFKKNGYLVSTYLFNVILTVDLETPKEYLDKIFIEQTYEKYLAR